MSRKKGFITLAAGIIIGMALAPASAQAVSEYLAATRSAQSVYVDGRQVQMEAYAINGSNYVRLRDVGQLLDVNVYWDGANVQIDTGSPYTGEAPASASAAPSVLILPPRTQSADAPVTQDVDTLRQQIVERTNAVRVANGLPALPTDPMLMQAAQVRAEEMAASGCYSHTRPDGTSRSTAADCKWTSENIHLIWQSNLDYKGVGLAELCVSEWAASPGHLRNMTTADSGSIGVGVAQATDRFGMVRWYCVEWCMKEGCTITWVDSPQIGQ